MKELELNSFKKLLFHDVAESTIECNTFFPLLQEKLKNSKIEFYWCHVFDTSNVNWDSIVDKFNDDLYLNYQKPDFEEDQFNSSRDSFDSLMIKNKIKFIDYAALIRLNYVTFETHNKKLLALLEIDKSITKFNKFRDKSGSMVLEWSNFKIELPFDYSIVGKLNTITIDDVREFTVNYDNFTDKNLLNLFKVTIGQRVKYDLNKTLLILEIL